MESRLGAAPCHAARSAGVEAVFEHIQVKAAQILGAKQLQLGHHGVKFVHLEVAQHLGLKFGCAGQGPAVNLQHLRVGHGILGGIKVAGVGQQKAQRVADAAVGIDHAGQDFVVNGQVARVVGRGAPQADDFRAHLAADLLRRDGVAQRFAHLLALAVHGEAVREQPPVGCAAKNSAGQQERAVKPAAVLVVAFQVQVGLGAFVVVHAGVCAAQHVPEGAARVEPHFQNVQAFGVVRRVFGPQDVFGGDAAPGFDAALLNDAGRLVDDFHRARVQLA